VDKCCGIARGTAAAGPGVLQRSVRWPARCVSRERMPAQLKVLQLQRREFFSAARGGQLGMDPAGECRHRSSIAAVGAGVLQRSVRWPARGGSGERMPTQLEVFQLQGREFFSAARGGQLEADPAGECRHRSSIASAAGSSSARCVVASSGREFFSAPSITG
jgi:hypothetical protein